MSEFGLALVVIMVLLLGFTLTAALRKTPAAAVGLLLVFLVALFAIMGA